MFYFPAYGGLASFFPFSLGFYGYCSGREKAATGLLYIAFSIMTISLTFDVLGDQWGLWHYRFNVLPILPTYLPWDLTLMPVAVIFLLQIKPEAHPFPKALMFALGTAYIAEPLIHWLGIYTTPHWRHTYSVPIQICIYLFAHYLSKRNRYQALND
ncbi:CBO0543 family protein [Paenibacillus aurantiacus]|uniref:CBO0543 family protein n=1 Tax=Paenibacillus aurantiacus TaxID=1936118 RepID=A0ABV5L0A4_9BACL